MRCSRRSTRWPLTRASTSSWPPATGIRPTTRRSRPRAARGLPHCVQDTPGAELSDGLDRTHIDVVIDTGMTVDADGYSAFESEILRELLREEHVVAVTVAGLATDYCVRHTAADALREGLIVTVEAARSAGSTPTHPARRWTPWPARAPSSTPPDHSTGRRAPLTTAVGPVPGRRRPACPRAPPPRACAGRARPGPDDLGSALERRPQGVVRLAAVGDDDCGHLGERCLASGVDVAQPPSRHERGVMMDRHPEPVETTQVQVALVLVQGLPRHRAGAGQRDLVPRSASRSAASRPSQPPPQSPTSTGPRIASGAVIAAHAVHAHAPGPPSRLRPVGPRARGQHDELGALGVGRGGAHPEPQLHARRV